MRSIWARPSVDYFTPLAQAAQERENLVSGKLSHEQLQNRQLLRKLTTAAGFIQAAD
jgi:hypothetical protein